jgi:UDP-glucose 6-dehydrogenase
MSSFAQNNNISADLFEFIAKSRDAQTFALARFIEKIYIERRIKTPVVVLGLAYKPNINLTLGSPASLLIHYLERLQIPFEIFDPHVFPSSQIPENSELFFVATKHDLFEDINFPPDSIVINPWGNFLLENGQKIEMLLPGRLKVN